MVEAFAVASGKGGTGKTTTTLALGMALARDHRVTVVDADTGMANLLFHAGLADVDVTLHDLLVGDADAETADAVYERLGMRVVPCGTDLAAFEAANPDVARSAATYDRFGMRVVPCGTDLADFAAADPGRLREVVADLAADADVLLLDSAAALGSKSAVLPVVLADRVVTVLQPTIPALSDGLKVREYARSYGTGDAGLLFNKVRDEATVDRVADRAARYFDGPVLANVPDSDAVREARRAGRPLLDYAPDAAAAAAFRRAADRVDVRDGDREAVADRFRSAVVPDPP